MNLYKGRAWDRLDKIVSEKAKEDEQYKEIYDLMLSIASDEFIKKDKGKDVALILTSFSNSFTPDTEGFVEEITNRTHRTLQQNTFRIFKETLKEWAKRADDERLYDHRNEATVKQSKIMVDATKDEYTPNY